jgi:hypothetical protein
MMSFCGWILQSCCCSCSEERAHGLEEHILHSNSVLIKSPYMNLMYVTLLAFQRLRSLLNLLCVGEHLFHICVTWRTCQHETTSFLDSPDIPTPLLRCLTKHLIGNVVHIPTAEILIEILSIIKCLLHNSIHDS